MRNEIVQSNIKILRDIAILQEKLEQRLRQENNPILERLHTRCLIAIEDLLDNEEALVIEV